MVTTSAAGGAATAADGLTRARLEQRWRAIGEAVMEARLDALVVGGRGVIGNFGHLMYTCGYTPTLRSGFAVFLAGELEPTLFVPSVDDVDRIRSAGLLAYAHASGEADHAGRGVSSAACAARHVAARRPARVGLAGVHKHVSADDRDSIMSALATVEVVDAEAIIRQLKSLKSPWEVDAMRRALSIGRAAYDAASSLLRPGAEAQEIVAELERILRAARAREVLVFVDARPNLNWRTTETRLDVGDLVTVLIENADECGYWVEQGGLFAIGTPSTEAATVADACYRTLELVEAAARPGTTAQELAALLDEVAADEGMDTGIVLGHGVGVDHDTPTLNRTDSSPLEAGNVLSVHPHFRVSRALGGAVADVLYVDVNATESLALLPRALTVLE